MSRIHFLIDEEDKRRYEVQASREGLSLGAWLREAAEERYQAARTTAPFTSADEVRAFFEKCDAAEGRGASGKDPEREPDWEEHRALLEDGLRGGLDS